jgi:hypothetical protein
MTSPHVCGHYCGLFGISGDYLLRLFDRALVLKGSSDLVKIEDGP